MISTKGVDITTDLVGGDVDIRVLGDTNERYRIVPQKIMVTNAANSVQTVIGVLWADEDSKEMTFNLQTNVEYDLSFRRIKQTGTTTQNILILGKPL